MSEFAFLHRPVSSELNGYEEVTPSLLVWKTCRRQILFLDFQNPSAFETKPGPDDELYQGEEAEIFLAEILCGLRSQLLGETEVFGQFKAWWKEIPADHSWKMQNHQRIDALFTLVKNVREKVLCGSGSQSYGSLLRKHLTAGHRVELVGGGHLAQEIWPWVQAKAQGRIWCRNPEKVRAHFAETEILDLAKNHQALGPAVVIAAPMDHEILNQWLEKNHFSEEHSLFDLRASSETFQPLRKPKTHLTLKDFATSVEDFQSKAEDLLKRSRQLIFAWVEQQRAKAQIRPYGWDDL